MGRITSDLKTRWGVVTANLIDRRNSGISDNKYTPPAVFDAASHFTKCKLGQSVLEVGVGRGDYRVKSFCPGEYFCIDAFPAHPLIPKAEIETFAPERTYETIVAFAVLDCVYDFGAAIANMKKLCTGNIIILTGLNIPPDEFHTLELTEEMFVEHMLKGDSFLPSYKEELFPNVFLLEYTRNRK